MAAALLAKLKVNNPPEVKQQFEIKIRGDLAAAAPDKQERGATTMTITDISKTAKFDRATFLNTLQQNRKVLTKEPVAAPRKEPIAPVEPTAPRKIKLPRKTAAKPAPAPVQEPAPAPVQVQVPEQEQEQVPEQEQEPVQEQAAPKKITIRKTKKPAVAAAVPTGPFQMIMVGDADITTRLKKRNEAPITIPASSYYMNNREIFANFMTSLFGDYKKNLAKEAAIPATCPGDNDVNDFSLMTHQQIVRDYLNLYTPYRGLLLYHGLGSGKTCSSIAIAEGLKNAKPIIVMTPASLQMNYREELKKCGDELYKKNQYWEFISTKGADAANVELVDTLSKVLLLSPDYINKNGGAWLVNMTKPSNYDELSSLDKIKLETQIDQMIAYKYRFMNYNGLSIAKLNEYTQNNTVNFFDNSVVIVDEAHNLVSRIVNKLGKKKASIGVILYQLLMKAKNVKIVLLSGTPIINYPNEIGVLFNILRGYITSWSFKLDILADRPINTTYLQSLFKSSILGGNILDVLDYRPASTTLMITRNPFGFVNKTAAKDNTYAGVKLELGERGEISDQTFLTLVTAILKKNNIKVQPNSIAMKEYKALPDTLDEFKSYFIEETGSLKNTNMFKRRILGLNSYFRSAQESLMPRYKKTDDFKIIKVEMSDFQFTIYEEARASERDQERKNALKKKLKKPGVEGLYENTSSTYRIFSRAFCNFVFPQPTIRRPMPDKKTQKGEEANLAEAVKEINEDDIDALSKKERARRDEDFEEEEEAEDADDADEAAGAGSYKDRIQRALQELKKDAAKYLSPEGLQVYSPKFLNILENILDEDHEGIHLIYTQFRALEGIGILKLILEANGFAQFKIKKTGETWELDIPEEEIGKPMFALYTGTETTEEKKHILNILNSAWKYVPETIVRKLKTIAPNNNLGEIIKVLMITSSGAEGISLKNVRYVHITEPYWHPVRTEQVIGRARRICSHQALPPELRTVDVFLYIMKLSAKQLESAESLQLRMKDKSRKDDATAVTTDEAIYEIASAKEDITNSILRSVKEASIDCTLHTKSNAGEKLQCFSFGSDNATKLAYNFGLDDEQSDTMAIQNQKEVTWKAKEVELGGTKYALNPKTMELYDLESYRTGNLGKIGKLVEITKGEWIIDKTFKI
jgi:hypothetical protein